MSNATSSDSPLPVLATAEELHAWLRGKVPLSTIRFWAWEGKLPSVKRGRRRLFRRHDVLQFFGLTSADLRDERSPA